MSMRNLDLEFLLFHHNSLERGRQHEEHRRVR